MKIPNSITAGLVCLLVLLSSGLSAQSPVVNVQGILKDVNGAAVDDGTQSLTFRLYRESTGGMALWQEEAPVTIVGGIYSYNLGSGTTILTGDIFASTVYFTVEVDGEEFSPRTRIAYAPYAFAVNSANKIARGGCSGQVGDIKYSILPPEKFAQRNGNCWVPMDGRGIPGTDLVSFMSIINIPNMSGKFLRATEYNDDDGDNDPDRGNDEPYTTQLSDNKKHGHNTSTHEDGETPHKHNYYNSFFNYFESGDDYSSDLPSEVSIPRNGISAQVQIAPNTIQRQSNFDVVPGSSMEFENKEAFPFNTGSGAHNHTVSESGGDGRPINMNFFIYIRVN